MASAEDEARDLGASAVEPEHLLLGIMQLDGPLAAMLRGYGLDLESVRRFLTMGDPGTRAVAFSGSSRRTLERSLGEALHRESNFIGAEHLFLACVVDEDGRRFDPPLGRYLTAGASGDGRVPGSEHGPEPTTAQVVRLLESAFGPVAVEHEGIG